MTDVDQQPTGNGTFAGRRPEDEAGFVEQWRDAAYNCFSSGHKFCREVCPVMQVTRNETWTPTAFHANVVAMEQGELTIEDVAADYVNCTQCGACELRCPNTLFTGDFYRFRTRTVDLVKAMRALAVDNDVHQSAWQRWNQLTDERTHEPVLNGQPVSQEHVRDWAAGLELPVGGETILFVDCEAAFYRTSLPRAVAQILTARRGRVRADERAVVLRRACCGDGVCGPGAALRRAQPGGLASRRSTDDPRARPARLHQLHRGLPEVLRRRLRPGDRAGRGAVRPADPGGQAHAERCRSNAP